MVENDTKRHKPQIGWHLPSPELNKQRQKHTKKPQKNSKNPTTTRRTKKKNPNKTNPPKKPKPKTKKETKRKHRTIITKFLVDVFIYYAEVGSTGHSTRNFLRDFYDFPNP